MTGPTLEELRTWIFATVPEIATVTRNDPRTIRKAIQMGEIPACRFGDTIRIPVAPFLKQCGLDLDSEDSEAGVTTPGVRHDISHQLADRHIHDHPPAA